MQSFKQQLITGVAYTAVTKYAGMVISLIVAGILARLLPPEDFGTIAVATVIISFFGIFSDFGFEPAIVQFKTLTEKDLSSIFSFTMWSGAIFSVLFFFLSWPISAYYKSPDLLNICQLLSINLFFATINIVPNAIVFKNKLFKFIAKRTLIVQCIGGVASIIAAFSGFGVYSLLINPIFSSIVIFIINYKKFPQDFHLFFGLESIKKVFSFSAFQFLFNIINYFSRNLDLLIIGKYLGLSLLGFYEKSYRLMMLPLQNISHVISPVMHPIFSDFQNDLNLLASSYEKVVRFLSYIGFPLTVFLYFTAKELILIIFGPNWLPSVVPFEILSLSVGIQIIFSTSGSVFQASNSTKLMFISGLISSFFTISGIFIAVFVFKTIEAVALSITITLTLNFIQAYLMIYILIFKRSIYNLIKQFFSPLALSVILVVVNLLFSIFIQIDNLFISLVAKAGISGIIFLIFIQISGEYDVCKKIKALIK